MAQKRKSTKKGLAFESLDIDLNKNIDIEAGKDAVGAEKIVEAKEEIAEAKKVVTPVPVPKKKPTPPKTKAKKPEVKEELIRTTIDFPKSEHRKLKILAMDKDMKLYQYLYSIIKKHLDKQP